jgi:hypothetical protein
MEHNCLPTPWAWAQRAFANENFAIIASIFPLRKRSCPKSSRYHLRSLNARNRIKLNDPVNFSLTHLSHRSFTTVASLLVLNTLLLARSLAAQPVTLTVGRNINISKSSENNAEECIAINPKNPLNLFVSETWSLMTKYSKDGGVTWSNSDVSALPASIGDVAAAFDTFGNLFLVRFGTSDRVAIGLSTNGGTSFTLLFQPSGNNTDQPSVTTGPSAVSGQATVWVNYTTSSGSLVFPGILPFA